jgi:putative SOS response-associated peptidase YedK
MCGKFRQIFSDGTLRTVMPMHMAEVLHLWRGLRRKKEMRWGFVRQSANDPFERPDHMHARCETLDEKLTFREAFRERRGLLEVQSFNEGHEVSKNRTDQYVVRRKDGKPLYIAVIYELWVNARGDELYTFVMVTTPANELIATISDRMSALLPEEHHAKWLGEEKATFEELKAMLTPYPSELLTMEPEKRTPPPKRPQPAREDQPSLF